MQVSSGASCFLDIVFQRVRYVEMHDKAHVTLVNSHTEGGRCDHYLYLVADEFLLVLNLDDFLHLAMECLGRETVIAQLLREFFGEPCT